MTNPTTDRRTSLDEEISLEDEITSVPEPKEIVDPAARRLLAISAVALLGFAFILHYVTAIFDDSIPMEDVFKTWIPILTGIAFGVFGFYFKDVVRVSDS